MKKQILSLLILLMSFTVCASNFKPDEPVSRIGYTTNYGYGMQSSVNVMYSPDTYQPQRPYAGSYNPGHPRLITVYDGNGNTAQTPGGSGDPEGIYRYDDITNTWYYSPDNGVTWYEWRKAEGFWERFIGFFGGGWGNDWRPYNGGDAPPEDTGKWASDPNDPFLDPIGDVPAIFVIVFLSIYLFYKKKNV